MKDTNGIDNVSFNQAATTLDLVLNKLEQDTLEENSSFNQLEGALEPNVKFKTQCIQYVVLSESFSKICRYLKNLYAIKDISREKIQNLLYSCLRELPDENRCNTEDLVVFSYGNEPDLFYLKWIKNIQPCKLLLYWLTDMNQTNQLDTLSFDSPYDLINHLVVVQFDVDNCWYRARVIQYEAAEQEEGNFQCFFIDYGNTELIPTGKLRRLPDELVNIPPYIFQAKLDFSDTEITLNEDLPALIKFKCVQKLKSYGIMKCQVTQFEENGCCQVKLWCSESSTYLASEVMKDKNKFDMDREDYDFDEAQYENILDSYPLPEESRLLSHKTEELGIMPNTEPDLLNECINYKISKVVNPDLFYVTNQNHSRKYVDLQRRMAEFYSDENWKESYKIRTSRVFSQRNYVWNNNGLWERVTCLRGGVDMPKGKAFVHRLDYLENAVVNISEMMEFNPKFCFLPPQCHRAHLAHIIPPNNQEDWSPEAIEMLKQIFRIDQIFCGMTMCVLKSFYTETGERKEGDSLALIVRPSSPDLRVTVQTMLVALNMAVGTGIGAGHLDLIFYRGTFPKDLYSLSNNNGYITNFSTSYRGRRRRFGRFKNGLSKLYSSNYSDQPPLNQAPLLTRKSILSGKNPGKLVGETEQLQSYESPRIKKWQKVHLKKNLEVNTIGIPDEIGKYLGEIVFSHVNGPSNFYVRMAYKEEEFGKMQKLLAEKAEESEQLSADLIHPGLLVIALYLNEDFVPSWQRGFINETSPDVLNAKVILIDIGVEILCKYYYIRPLPQEFLNIPPFCRRVHLLIPDYMPCGINSWTSLANTNFKKYIEAWQVTDPTYFAYLPTLEQDRIEMNYFNEDLKFCRQQNEWITDEFKPWMQNGEANNQKSHPLLVHLFSSLGIVIWYENIDDKDPDPENSRNFNKPLSFSPIWDNLFSSGFVHPIPELK